MERESLLTILIVLLGGVTLQLCAAWPAAGSVSDAQQLERRRWTRLWWPLVPVLLTATWLCGWALSESDPVPDRIGWLVFVACIPFALLVLRALARAAWSLLRRPHGLGIATVGLLRPRIVLAQQLLADLDAPALEAALAHERAHARHRDPLRIWLAQLVTDLQWPWPAARRRLRQWLAALECARDDEARAAGVDGADLAAAILRLLRTQRAASGVLHAALTGEDCALQERIGRLLNPLVAAVPADPAAPVHWVLLLTASSACALTLGCVFGERVLGPLLAIGS